MKICLLSNALAVHTHRWAKAYAERGHEVHVFSIRSDNIPGVRVQTVCIGPINSKSKWWAFLSYLRLMLSVKRRLKVLRPDILHAQYTVTHGAIAAFSRFHPRVVSCWGSDVIWDKPGRMPWFFRFLNRVALKNADLVCSTSRFMTKVASQFLPLNKSIEQIPFGVDYDRFKPAQRKNSLEEEGGFRCGFVKTFAPKYGPETLIRAMRRVVDVVPEAKLVMAGRGPIKEKLQHLVTQLGLDEYVEFVGFIPNDQVPDLMQTFDAFVNCSTTESFGVAILEASACGLPVVVTKVGGVAEVCLEGQTGIMVEANNSKELAQALIRLAKDRDLRTKMGLAGRKFVLENYIWRDNVDKMLTLMEGMLFKSVKKCQSKNVALEK